MLFFGKSQSLHQKIYILMKFFLTQINNKIFFKFTLKLFVILYLTCSNLSDTTGTISMSLALYYLCLLFLAVFPDIALTNFSCVDSRVPQNCPRTYKLISFDPDGDRVRCRYGNINSDECYLCKRHSGFHLDQVSCKSVS